MDDELEHSPQIWLDDFTQWFSWRPLSAQASPFLNNHFLPGVSEMGVVPSNKAMKYPISEFRSSSVDNHMMYLVFRNSEKGIRQCCGF